PQPQAGVTYAHKIAKEETRIAWERPWQEVHNHVRGLSPVPGAWFEIAGEGLRVKALRTTKGEGAGMPGTVLDDELTLACGEGAVHILDLQRGGRQAMRANEFLRGTSIAVGTRFVYPPPCLATSSPSNMTADRSWVGKSRTTVPRCRACWRPQSRHSAERR